MSGQLLVAARGAVRSLGTVFGLKRSERVILVVPVRPDTQGADLAHTIQEAWSRRGYPNISAGVSGPSGQGRDFATAYREALVCLNFARIAGARGAALTYDNLGPLRFLLDAHDARYAIEFVKQRLGALNAFDRTHGSAYMPTIRAYLEADGHHPTTAQRSFIHISTLKYRLSRIADIVGAPLNDPDLKFELRLAFRPLDLFQAMGVEVLP